MYYSSLVPCVLSSLVAFYIAQAFGLTGEAYPLGTVMPLSLPSALLTVLLAVLCALAAIIFSLESVFAALGGMLLLHERMRVQGYIGCALIFAGILVSRWIPKKQK
jgi:drug/metabolite transporter (DMT)-like permease